MNYCTIHIDKSTTTSGALGRHIDRKMQPCNADPDKAHLNFAVAATFNDGKISLKRCAPSSLLPLVSRVNARIAEGYKGTKAIRKDAVKQLNIMLTGSHEALTAMTEEELLRWAAANYVFLQKRFGEKNIVGFVVHRDERTPHIHATVVPLTEDGRLSAKEIVGNNKKLAELQDDYALQMKKFGLQRGERGSKVTHVSTSEYYRALNMTDSLVDSLLANQEIQVPKPPKVEKPPINPLLHSSYVQKQQQELEQYKEEIQVAVQNQTKINRLNKSMTMSMFNQILEFLRLSRQLKAKLKVSSGKLPLGRVQGQNALKRAKKGL